MDFPSMKSSNNLENLIRYPKITEKLKSQYKVEQRVLDSPDSYRGKRGAKSHANRVAFLFLYLSGMHYLYILCSLKTGKYYVGETPDIDKRLHYHNSPELNTNSTKSGIPWELVKSFPLDDRSLALRIEKHVKKMKSSKYLENLIRYPEIIEKLKSQYKAE